MPQRGRAMLVLMACTRYKIKTNAVRSKWTRGKLASPTPAAFAAQKAPLAWVAWERRVSAIFVVCRSKNRHLISYVFVSAGLFEIWRNWTSGIWSPLWLNQWTRCLIHQATDHGRPLILLVESSWPEVVDDASLPMRVLKKEWLTINRRVQPLIPKQTKSMREKIRSPRYSHRQLVAPMMEWMHYPMPN